MESRPAGMRKGLTALAVILMLNQAFSFSAEVRYESGGRRDPFVPVDKAAAQTAAGGSLKIEGIIFDPVGKSVVVIGGETYAVGDSVGTQKIVKIEANKVTAEENGKQMTYWISSAEEELAQKAKL